MASYHEEEDPFEEDIVFDQAGLLNSSSKMNTAIRRVSSGKCVLFAKTLGLCGAFFGLGLCIAIPGPTFLSPLIELKSSLSPISNIYVARTSGYIIGSVFGGVLFDRFNRLFLLFLSLLLTAVFITITPWCQALWVLESCMIILGVTMGFLDTGGNVLCLDLWGRNSGPFMQALHFSFGLGAIVAPLLAAPFLEPTLTNSTLSGDFSHVITEFPVHLTDPTTLLYHEERLKRDAEEEKLFSSNIDNFTKNVTNGLPMSDSMFSNSGISTNLISSSEPSAFSIESHSDISSNQMSTPSTSTKPRTPKPKPRKTDASKLDNVRNWDKVHVGKPPASDLLPLSTSPVPSPLFSSFGAVTEHTASSNEDVSSVTISSVEILSTPASSSSVLEHNVSGNLDNFTGNHPSSINDPVSSTVPVTSNMNSSELVQVLSTTQMYDRSLSDLPKSSHVDHTTMSSDESTSFKELNNVAANKTNVLKQPKFTDFKANTSQNFPRRNEDTSHLSYDFPFPVEPSNPSHKDNEVSGSVQNRENKVNYSVLKTFSQYPGTMESDSRENSQNHNLNELSVDQTTSSKDMFNNVKEQVSVSKIDEDFSDNSDFKFSILNHNTESSDSAKPIEPLNLKTSDESVLYENSEISSTYDSIPSIAKVQHDEEDPSLKPSLVTNTLLISTTPGHPHHVHHKPGTFDNDTEHINTIFDIFANRIEQYGFNKIQFTYLIVGIFVFLISFIFLGFLCHNPRDPKSKQEGQGDKNITNKVVHKLFIALMALFFFLYMGLEVTYGQLVLAFARHSNLNLSQSTGSAISVVFWGSFAAMRFASIFFASGFSPVSMLLLNFTFCTCGTILVSALANHLETALWVGTVLIGVGLASMFPTGVLWIERYIHITNKVSAVFVIGVALGEMLCPVTIYRLMVIDPVLFMYAALVINIICILIFATLWWLASRQGEKYSVINNNGYQLANQHDEEEDMMDISPSGSGVLPRRHCFSSEHRSLLNGNMHRGP